jgi:hypothetical protein
MKHPLRNLALALGGACALTLMVAGAGYSFGNLNAAESGNRSILFDAGHNQTTVVYPIGGAFTPVYDNITGGTAGAYVDVSMGSLRTITYGNAKSDYYCRYSNEGTTDNRFFVFKMAIHNPVSLDLVYSVDAARLDNSLCAVMYFPNKTCTGSTSVQETLIEGSQVGDSEVILDTSAVTGLSFVPEGLYFLFDIRTGGAACTFTLTSLKISYSC